MDAKCIKFLFLLVASSPLNFNALWIWAHFWELDFSLTWSDSSKILATLFYAQLSKKFLWLKARLLERRELCLPYFAGWFPEKIKNSKKVNSLDDGKKNAHLPKSQWKCKRACQEIRCCMLRGAPPNVVSFFRFPADFVIDLLQLLRGFFCEESYNSLIFIKCTYFNFILLQDLIF